MQIFMARHGQTDSNVAGIIQGSRVDGPLNTEGQRQAEELAEKLRSQEFDVIFSSPLKRARETAAAILLGRDVPLELRSELMERDFGSLSGKTWAEIENSQELLTKDRAQKWDYRPYGGESSENFKARFLSVISEIRTRYPDKKVLLVAHAGILRLAHLLFKESEVAHIQNASVEEFDIG